MMDPCFATNWHIFANIMWQYCHHDGSWWIFANIMWQYSIHITWHTWALLFLSSLPSWFTWSIPKPRLQKSHTKKGRANVLQVTRTLPSMSQKCPNDFSTDSPSMEFDVMILAFLICWRMNNACRRSRDQGKVTTRGYPRHSESVKLCITKNHHQQCIVIHPYIPNPLLIGSKFYPNHARL